MKISAVIAEFNPLHAGHKLLIDSMKKQSDGVIAIMSGNFVQRGECAVFEKSDRAAAAVKNGVDLVLELPSVYALASAEGFAKGAVGILSACNVVDSLWFGSECGDIEELFQCAQALNEESPEFKKILSANLEKGLSFPKARQIALEEQLGKKSILDMPNNILGTEYIRELKRLNSSITPVTIKRIGAGYNDTFTDAPVPSASSIRTLMKCGENYDKALFFDYNGTPLFMESFDVIISAALKVISREDLCRIPDCNGEIASRLKTAAKYNTFLQIVEKASCKRYTQSRIRRILCNMMVGNYFSQLPAPTYIRPLAFNSKGSKILKEIKNTALLPVAARGAVLKNDDIFRLECRCSDIYNLARGTEGNSEFTSPAKLIR